MRRWLSSGKLWCFLSFFPTVKVFLCSGCFFPSSQGVAALQLLPLFLQFVPASRLKDCSKNKAHLLYIYFHSATNYNDEYYKFHFWACVVRVSRGTILQVDYLWSDAPQCAAQSHSKELLKLEKTPVPNEKPCADWSVYLVWIYLNNCENMCCQSHFFQDLIAFKSWEKKSSCACMSTVINIFKTNVD